MQLGRAGEELDGEPSISQGKDQSRIGAVRCFRWCGRWLGGERDRFLVHTACHITSELNK